MNDHCQVCLSEFCALREAATVAPSRGFRAAYPYGSLWSEFRAQSPARHVLNVLAAGVFVLSVYAFLVLVA